MDDDQASASTEEADAEDDYEDIFVTTNAGIPRTPSDDEIDISSMLEAHRIKRAGARVAGVPPQKMMRLTHDALRRKGYAYEDEPLLTYIKPLPNGDWIVVGGPASPFDGKRLTRAIASFDVALDAAFEVARKLPPQSPAS
jgi:hypothetical protein